MRRPETSATEYYFTISFVTLRSPSASFTIWNDGMEAVVPLHVPSYTSSGDFEASPLMKNLPSLNAIFTWRDAFTPFASVPLST